jgi:AcrR family transcriptional regulator
MARRDVIGVRARKRLHVRQQIEDCALRAFSERGFDDVTVEQVCRDAGVSPATFYRYFGAKEEVVFAYRDGFLEALRDAIAGAGGEPSPVAQLRGVLMRFAGYLQSQAGTLTMRDQIVVHHPGLLARTLAVQRDWECELAEGLARVRGVPPGEFLCQLHAAIGLAVLRVALRQWRAGQAPSLPAATSRALAAVGDFAAAFFGTVERTRWVGEAHDEAARARL